MQEYMVFEENNIVHAPKNWNCVEASTLPCAALTAWRTIVTEGKVNKNSIVLVQGLVMYPTIPIHRIPAVGRSSAIFTNLFCHNSMCPNR